MVLENTEMETSHSRNVCIIRAVLEQKLQWSSVAMLNFLSSFLVKIILCSILTKNCVSLLYISLASKVTSPVKKTVREIFFF